MAVFNKQSLLTDLLDRIELIKARAQPFLRLSNEQLNHKPAPEKWSIEEVFEHLNINHNIYIGYIMARITKAPDIKVESPDSKMEKFKSGWLGDWVYERTMPRPDGTIFKIKAAKFLRPVSTHLDGHDVLQRFLQHLDMLYDILLHARTKDLEGIRIPLAFNRLLKLRLGDNLRLMVAHCERHLWQAHKGMSGLPADLFDDHGAKVMQ